MFCLLPFFVSLHDVSPFIIYFFLFYFSCDLFLSYSSPLLYIQHLFCTCIVFFFTYVYTLSLQWFDLKTLLFWGSKSLSTIFMRHIFITNLTRICTWLHHTWMIIIRLVYSNIGCITTTKWLIFPWDDRLN